jgi:hypothetical protein
MEELGELVHPGQSPRLVCVLLPLSESRAGMERHKNHKYAEDSAIRTEIASHRLWCTSVIPATQEVEV